MANSVDPGSTLFARVSVLVCRVERINIKNAKTGGLVPSTGNSLPVQVKV